MDVVRVKCIYWPHSKQKLKKNQYHDTSNWSASTYFLHLVIVVYFANETGLQVN